MRMQNSQAACGPTAVHNALAALGIARSPEECETLCRTTATDGTSPGNLRAGLAQVPGVVPRPLREARGDVAMLKLEYALRHGRPVILLVDDDQHWVAAVGTLGERVLVADSADNDLVLCYDASPLAERWEGAGRYPYTGVIL